MELVSLIGAYTSVKEQPRLSQHMYDFCVALCPIHIPYPCAKLQSYTFIVAAYHAATRLETSIVPSTPPSSTTLVSTLFQNRDAPSCVISLRFRRL